MDHIKTLAVAPGASKTNSTTSPEKTSNETGLPKNWVSALFKHFQVIYGHKFNSSVDGIEDLAVARWSEALDGLTGEQIKTGLRLCGTRRIAVGQEDWPPTPAEFRALCLPEKVPSYHRDYVALPRPAVDPEFVASQISLMKSKLKGD